MQQSSLNTDFFLFLEFEFLAPQEKYQIQAYLLNSAQAISNLSLLAQLGSSNIRFDLPQLGLTNKLQLSFTAMCIHLK